MVNDAAAQRAPDSAISSEPRDAYSALREVVACEGVYPRADRPELRLALSECAALARRRMQPPEQYLVQIKACVREAGRAIDISVIEAFIAHVVTLSIAEYYRND